MPPNHAVTPERLLASAMKLLMQEPLFKVGSATIRGSDYRIFENAPENLLGVFREGAARGNAPFLHYDDETLSYEDLWRDAEAFGRTLAADWGVRKGDIVALAMRNYPEWCVAFMGVVSIGAVAAPLNAWWTTDEFRYALGDCGARIVIVDGKRLELISPLREEFGLKFILARDAGDAASPRLDEAVERGRAHPAVEVAIAADDDLAIYYTSGSTGKPKGVILTHRGTVMTLWTWRFIMSAITDANNGAPIHGDNPGVLLTIPLFHVTGSHAIFLLSYLIGRRVVIMRKWRADEAVRLIRTHAVTNFVGVPSQSYELIDAAGDEPMPSLIDIGSGGAKRPPEQVAALTAKFPQANASSGYGMTETSALGCVISLEDYKARPGAAGRPAPPLVEARIVGEAGDAPLGEVGEIWLRSAANFRGYLNLPKETAETLTPDGWVKTGDLGFMDAEGFITIVDRKKDMIIRGGENISCLEVEARAYEYHAVAEAAAFSTPCDQLNERVGLVVYPRPGEAIDPAALAAFMGQTLARFKCPERIWISPGPLPRLGTEKFDKRTIRAVALRHPPLWSA